MIPAVRKRSTPRMLPAICVLFNGLMLASWDDELNTDLDLVMEQGIEEQVLVEILTSLLHELTAPARDVDLEANTILFFSSSFSKKK